MQANNTNANDKKNDEITEDEETPQEDTPPIYLHIMEHLPVYFVPTPQEPIEQEDNDNDS